MRGLCSTCGVQPRSMAAHMGTQRHRRLTRPKAGRVRLIRNLGTTPSWSLAQHRDEADYATPEQRAAAEAWARDEGAPE